MAVATARAEWNVRAISDHADRGVEAANEMPDGQAQRRGEG